ncbi:MAG TPA: DNA-directed RNA polymerase subunit omega [Thermoanaerobacterales bacterium]|nr:DNA-directed RNA polymerase subunit omega [Thermoanaerobacterales bacterium]
MIYPSVDSLIKNVDSKYTLVIFAAKRARQLVEKSNKESEIKKLKPVSIALQEIDQGKISYKRTKSSIK